VIYFPCESQSIHLGRPCAHSVLSSCNLHILRLLGSLIPTSSQQKYSHVVARACRTFCMALALPSSRYLFQRQGENDNNKDLCIHECEDTFFNCLRNHCAMLPGRYGPCSQCQEKIDNASSPLQKYNNYGKIKIWPCNDCHPIECLLLRLPNQHILRGATLFINLASGDNRITRIIVRSTGG
jgi:hypothetical protein